MRTIGRAAAAAAGVAAVAAAALAGAPATAAPAGGDQHAVRGVCAGVAHCTVVDHTRVDPGDGDDAVGLVLAGEHRAVLRVLTDDGERSALPLAVGEPSGGATYAGATDLDLRGGDDVSDELVVRTDNGASASLYAVATWRHGGLRHLAQPDGDARWTVNSTVSDVIGIEMTNGGYVGLSHASRVAGGHAFDGRATYWFWQGGWKKLDGHALHFPGYRKAATVAGWHVYGLPRFP